MIVREPDNYYWYKLVHILEYIRGTRNLTLTLSSNGRGILKWWVDGSFYVHPNMRGHTDGEISTVRWFPVVSSTKQKLNTQRFTETETVAVDDFTNTVLWTRYWLDAQKYDFLIILYINTIKLIFSFGKERQGFKQKAHKAHKHHIIFNNISHLKG